MDPRAEAWYRRRTSHWTDWPLARLLEHKQQSGIAISVVIPARNEERTVARVVGPLVEALVSDAPLVDELVVIDSDSSDATGAAASAAGAIVHRARDIAPALGAYRGKGEALWKSLLVTSGDVLVFVDADLTQWGPHFVTGLLGPLLADPGVHLVKGFYDRVRTEEDGSVSTEGGRVTELVARPLLSLWWPHLAGVVQPLAGEWAARRSLMESLSVPVGYGVELSTLLDTTARHGLDALAQVDLGARAHHHQANHDLAVMAAELLALAENRRSGPHRLIADVTLEQFVREGDQILQQSRSVPTHERPPARTVGAAGRDGADGRGGANGRGGPLGDVPRVQTR